MSHRLPAARCPVCAAKHDAVTAAVDSTGALLPDSKRPAPGDLSICFYCGALLQFAPDMSLLCFDIAKLDEDSQFQIRRVQIAVQHKSMP